jgi:hypothetical protein
MTAILIQRSGVSRSWRLFGLLRSDQSQQMVRKSRAAAQEQLHVSCAGHERRAILAVVLGRGLQRLQVEEVQGADL